MDISIYSFFAIKNWYCKLCFNLIFRIYVVIPGTSDEIDIFRAEKILKLATQRIIIT